MTFYYNTEDGEKNEVNIFLKRKMPVIAHIKKKPAVYVKYHSAKRKLVGLNTFECNIVVPFGAVELTGNALKGKKKKKEKKKQHNLFAFISLHLKGEIEMC